MAELRMIDKDTGEQVQLIDGHLHCTAILDNIFWRRDSTTYCPYSLFLLQGRLCSILASISDHYAGVQAASLIALVLDK